MLGNRQKRQEERKNRRNKNRNRERMTVIRRKLRNNTNKIARKEKKEEVTRGRNETGK
jgi:hypothetical protein